MFFWKQEKVSGSETLLNKNFEFDILDDLPSSSKINSIQILEIGYPH